MNPIIYNQTDRSVTFLFKIQTSILDKLLDIRNFSA
jgi:hypothetical protein